MEIRKELKKVSFRYDIDDKLLNISDFYETTTLTRIEMFSLARFILRIAQKGTKRNVK